MRQHPTNFYQLLANFYLYEICCLKHESDLVIIKLRLILGVRDLAYRTGVTAATVSHTIVE